MLPFKKVKPTSIRMAEKSACVFGEHEDKCSVKAVTAWREYLESVKASRIHLETKWCCSGLGGCFRIGKVTALSLSPQIVQKLRHRLNSRYKKIIPRASARHVQQLPFRVIDFLEIRLISNAFDPFLKR